MRSNPRALRLFRVMQALLCVVWFLSPWFILLSRPSPIRIPLGIFSCGLSIACGFLLPGTIRRIRYPESRLEPWSPLSNASRIWQWLNRICGVLGLASLLAALFFIGQSRHSGIDRQWTLTAFGMVLNFWSMLIASYRLRRNSLAAAVTA